MAKVTAPLHSAEARGRVGGLVYNTWRGIATVKAKCAPAQPRSALQMILRSLAITLARKWQTIDAAKRTAWNNYATAHQTVDWTGNPVRTTGLNWYVALNTRLAKYTGTYFADPPAVAAPAAVTAFAAAGGVLQIVLTWNDTGLATGYVIGWLSGPHSAGQIASLQKARYKTFTAVATETTTITGLSAGTYDVWAEVLDSATGLVSTKVVATATVTAT